MPSDDFTPDLDRPVDDAALEPFGEPVAPAFFPAFFPAALRRLGDGMRRSTRPRSEPDASVSTIGAGSACDRGRHAATLLRTAFLEETPEIAAVQAAAMRRGCAAHYELETIDRLIASGTLLDRDAVGAGRYRVCIENDRIVAGAGWDDRAPGTDSADAPDTAWMRGVFVHPEQGGRGLGRCVVGAVEKAALAAGRPRMRLLATLNAVPFYRKLGYRLLGARTLPLAAAPDGAPAFVGAILEKSATAERRAA